MSCVLCTEEQSSLSFRAMKESGFSFAENITAMAENRAGAKIEHAMKLGMSGVTYDIRDGELYSPGFKTTFNNLIDPPVERRSADYPAMPAHVIENLREAQRLLTSGSAQSLVLLSPSIDFAAEGSTKGQAYFMFRQGDQVVVISTDHSADVSQMAKEARSLYGIDTSAPIAGNQINGGGVFHTTSAEAPTRQQVLEAIKEHGNRALAEQYQNAIYLGENIPPQEYFARLVEREIRDIQRMLSESKIDPEKDPRTALREAFEYVERDLQAIRTEVANASPVNAERPVYQAEQVPLAEKLPQLRMISESFGLRNDQALEIPASRISQQQAAPLALSIEMPAMALDAGRLGGDSFYRSIKQEQVLAIAESSRLTPLFTPQQLAELFAKIRISPESEPQKDAFRSSPVPLSAMRKVAPNAAAKLPSLKEKIEQAAEKIRLTPDGLQPRIAAEKQAEGAGKPTSRKSEGLPEKAPPERNNLKKLLADPSGELAALISVRKIKSASPERTGGINPQLAEDVRTFRQLIKQAVQGTGNTRIKIAAEDDRTLMKTLKRLLEDPAISEGKAEMRATLEAFKLLRRAREELKKLSSPTDRELNAEERKQLSMARLRLMQREGQLRRALNDPGAAGIVQVLERSLQGSRLPGPEARLNRIAQELSRLKLIVSRLLAGEKPELEKLSLLQCKLMRACFELGKKFARTPEEKRLIRSICHTLKELIAIRRGIRRQERAGKASLPSEALQKILLKRTLLEGQLIRLLLRAAGGGVLKRCFVVPERKGGKEKKGILTGMARKRSGIAGLKYYLADLAQGNTVRLPLLSMIELRFLKHVLIRRADAQGSQVQYPFLRLSMLQAVRDVISCRRQIRRMKRNPGSGAGWKTLLRKLELDLEQDELRLRLFMEQMAREKEFIRTIELEDDLPRPARKKLRRLKRKKAGTQVRIIRRLPIQDPQQRLSISTH